MRDAVRAEMEGQDLTFVVLDMALEDQVHRLGDRHGGDDNAVRIMKVGYELLGGFF